jgi:hypothetical protein
MALRSAAITVQSLIRSKQQTQRWMQLKHAALVIQSAFRY